MRQFDSYCTECLKVTDQLDNTTHSICMVCGAQNSLLNYDGTAHPYKKWETAINVTMSNESNQPAISKEKILKKHIISGKEDSYGYGSSLDIVVSPPQNIYAAMQEYLYLKTAVKDKEIAELKGALIYLMKGVEGLPPLSAIEGVLIPHFKKAKETIEKYS